MVELKLGSQPQSQNACNLNKLRDIANVSSIHFVIHWLYMYG